MWSPSKITPPSSKRRCRKGVGNSGGASVRPETSVGIAISMTASTWARPMVATVATSRGDLRKRRITTTSTRAPFTPAPTSITAAAIQ